ncbi:AAA family ATPase [Ferrovibrio sp.]|uniref:bifunctional aminoglycoside phosphotransferase/ATP-binding protein n=1 Tax=Ferrovibrio sp. TaxID=1917215 RepID=UPI00311DDDF8
MADANPADIAALFNPPPDAVIETHISRVFLSGDRAWKLKKAVSLPYVDFSTLERRHAACERELVLNRRTAPDLYLGLQAVRRAADGRLALDDKGVIVDWLVEMQRFDPEQTLDRVIARGELTTGTVTALAAEIACFHGGAERVDTDGAAALDVALRANEAGFHRLDAAALPAAELARYREALGRELAAQAGRLGTRRPAGRIRRAHGDLHLRNIVLLDGHPVLFDCLEFDDGLATCDTLYDFAFLLMDLLARGRRDLANAALSRYLEVSGDHDGVALLPLYVAVRAAVRCHVAALNPETWPEARRYLSLARSALVPAHPVLIAIGGLSGTGKSTVARTVAPTVHAVCGAVILRSDVIRKSLHGRNPQERLPAEAYSPAASQQTYAVLYEQAHRLLAGGNAVVLDAVFGRADEAAAVQALAKETGAEFSGLWLEAPEDLLRARVMARRNDASDADAAVVRWQSAHLQAPEGWCHIDASGRPEDTVARVQVALAAATSLSVPVSG